MDRDCNKCVYHTSGSCSAWECKGTKTVDDVRADAIEEVKELTAQCVSMSDADWNWFESEVEQLKENKNV